MWKQRLEAVSDLEGPHFSAGMPTMAKYTQYLFNLQHNTARTIMQQRMRLTTYDDHNTSMLFSTVVHFLLRIRTVS
jgi:hypothetical protein